MLVCFRLPWKQRIDRKETVCSAAAHPGLPKKPKSFKMPSPSRWFPGTAKLNHHARLDRSQMNIPENYISFVDEIHTYLGKNWES